jgi:hypothetical protein
MKKSIFFILLLGITGTMSAQTFAIGLKGGYEAAMSYNDLLNTNLVTSTGDQIKSGFANGYQVGAWMRLGGKRVYLQPEVLLNVKKVSQTFNVGGLTYMATYKTQAIEIPLMVGYKVLCVGPLAVRLNAGPKAIIDAGSSSNLNQYSQVLSQDFKKTTWAAEGGIGVDILSVSLDLRYSQYLSNSYSVTFNNTPVVNMKSNKQSVYLTLGWRLF